MPPTCTNGTLRLDGNESSPMARFYFDSGERSFVFEDEIGVECTGIAEARRAGLEGLIDLTRDALKDVDGQQLLVEVRDEKGDRILRLSLALEIKLLG